MGVQNHVFVHFAPAIYHARQRIDPGIICDEFLRHDRRAFGRKAKSPNVVDIQQAIAQFFELIGFELIHIATADHHIFDFGTRLNIPNRIVPSRAIDPKIDLFHIFCIQPHGIAAGAKSAIHGTGVQYEE